MSNKSSDLHKRCYRLFFWYQFFRNRMPMANAGPAMVTDQDSIYHSNSGFLVNRKIYNSPAKINVTAPTISCLHEIMSNSNKSNAGMLWINKAVTICRTDNPDSKTSKENIMRNRTNSIPKILGVQKIYLLIFCTILILISISSVLNYSEPSKYYFFLI